MAIRIYVTNHLGPSSFLFPWKSSDNFTVLGTAMGINVGFLTGSRIVNPVWSTIGREG